MRLGVHLSYERNKRKLTRKELSELIQQHIAITVDPSTIENWEKEMTSVDVRVLPYLAALFGYSIEELVNPEVGPNEEEVLEMLGQDICDWCLVNSLDEFYQSYSLINKNDYVFLPKYDLIMRAYFDYLRKTDRNIYRVRDGVEDLEWHASITTRFIPLQHDHAADSVTIDDHRDPIDYRELRKDLEFTYSEIRMLLEEYKDVDEVKPWHYLKY